MRTHTHTHTRSSPPPDVDSPLSTTRASKQHALNARFGGTVKPQAPRPNYVPNDVLSPVANQLCHGTPTLRRRNRANHQPQSSDLPQMSRVRWTWCATCLENSLHPSAHSDSQPAATKAPLKTRGIAIQTNKRHKLATCRFVQASKSNVERSFVARKSMKAALVVSPAFEVGQRCACLVRGYAKP